MPYETIARTDVGQMREVNEDAVHATTGDGWGLLVVADGMGGHAAGEVASEAAIEAFTETVSTTLAGSQPDDVAALLATGVHDANDRLRAMIDDDPSLDGMGTTLVAAVLTDTEATLVNVGDSRGYLVAETDIEQVTTDHSLVQQLVEDGEITPEEASDHPQRNVVSQALGTGTAIDPDIFSIDLEGWILLCSDGLSEEVPDNTIQQIVAVADDPQEAARELIARANDSGGSDNISVAIGRTVD